MITPWLPKGPLEDRQPPFSSKLMNIGGPRLLVGPRLLRGLGWFFGLRNPFLGLFPFRKWGCRWDWCKINWTILVYVNVSKCLHEVFLKFVVTSCQKPFFVFKWGEIWKPPSHTLVTSSFSNFQLKCLLFKAADSKVVKLKDLTWEYYPPGN